MINNQTILTAFTGRLAFRQPTQTGYAILNTANSTSKSGKYFDDVHALVTAKNIKDAHDDAAITDEQFNACLTSLQQSAILRAVGSMGCEADLIDDTLLFNRQGIDDTVAINTGKFVGYRIKAAEATQIKAVRLYFQAFTPVLIHLFHDGQATALKTQVCNAQPGAITRVELTDFILDADKGGFYYIGYFSDVLAADQRPVNEKVAAWVDPICFGYETVQIDRIPYADMLNLSTIQNSSETNGLNLEIATYRDSTSKFTRNVSLFDELVALNMAYMVIEKIIHSARSNANERNMKNGIDKTGLIMDLKGTMPISDAPSAQGIDQRINKEVQRLRKSFEAKPRGISIIC